MNNLILLIFGVFFNAANAEFALNLLQPDKGVVTSNFSNSLILTLPPCTLAGMTVNLTYNETGTGKSTLLTKIFTVPACRPKRDLISVTANDGQLSFTKNVGYQAKNLASGTEYSFQYAVGTEKSNVLTASTRTATSYTQIDSSLPGRSAAMIVITVVLSMAMFVLIVGLILSILLGTSDD
ncbi:hypothetical protein GJAV_G00137790 [Gymnothorax javanicus]|nr:hypothetical protein GJAV_G00137790 [Gymnothorax javanicus]